MLCILINYSKRDKYPPRHLRVTFYVQKQFIAWYSKMPLRLCITLHYMDVTGTRMTEKKIIYFRP